MNYLKTIWKRNEKTVLETLNACHGDVTCISQIDG